MQSEVTTATQDGWKELAGALRVQILKACSLTGAMTPQEVGQLISAARELYWLDVWAATFDNEVDLRMARTCASD